MPCCAISPEISAEQVADFLQHRLLKLKPGHTAGADPLPLMNSLAIQPRWQAVVERWLAFLVTQRRLKPAAEGYQVCAGEEREDEHPHFSGHDLTLSQILRGARNELSLLNDAQWSPESLPLTIRPAPRIFRNWRQFANSLHSAYSARYACLRWEPALAAPQNRC